MTLTRDALLSGAHRPTTTVDITGGTVVVRGLSRAEAMAVRHAGDEGSAEQEQAIMALGLVDPAMSDADVKEWYGIALAGDVQAVCIAVQELSGLGDGAGKEVTKSPAHGRRRR